MRRGSLWSIQLRNRTTKFQKVGQYPTKVKYVAGKKKRQSLTFFFFFFRDSVFFTLIDCVFGSVQSRWANPSRLSSLRLNSGNIQIGDSSWRVNVAMVSSSFPFRFSSNVLLKAGCRTAGSTIYEGLQNAGPLEATIIPFLSKTSKTNGSCPY